ncbi:TLC domain-containing protein 4-B-like [Branchiostoma lanceolatum]|uniref:TLC domain-containing protein 4-B-like n=1 Tax=Branchiostoma lanceolatum TaxID=7740 RepID=UPI003453365C
MAYSVQHVQTILGSFFFHLAVFKWFAAPVLRRLWPVFATLPADKQVSSQNYVMSLIHGAVVGGLSWYAFLFSYVPQDKLLYDSPNVRHGACIVMGHAAADLLLIAWYPSLRSREMVVHHVCALWVTYCGSVDPAGAYYGNLSLMTELSSPFLNLRHILHNMGQKTSLLYKVNGVVLLVVFFICRILTIPLWFSLRKHLGTDKLYEVGIGVQIGLYVIFPLLNLLNVFWFSKICRAAYRGFFGSKAE